MDHATREPSDGPIGKPLETQQLWLGWDVHNHLRHRFSVDDYEKAFDVMRGGETGKVILEWSD